MSNRRTTPQLVTTALKGAENAGISVVAADVHGGGFVRVYFTDPHEAEKPEGVVKECVDIDDIFEMGCV